MQRRIFTPRNGQILALCIAATLAAGVLPASAATAATTGEAAVVVKTESGLQYKDVIVGKGPVAVAGRPVQVHYTGWLQNPDGSTGTKFDSSKDRGEPFVFALGGGQVIRGWDEGVVGMHVGGMRRLVIPSALGYGARGAGGVIPPNATLLFDVELLGLK